MPTEIIMPKVDMDMTSGTIATWHITEGQSIKQGDALFDIETDKSTMEVESPASGKLHFVSANNGDVVEIGTCIGWIFADGEAVQNPGAAVDTPATANIPDTQETIADTAPPPPSTDITTGGAVRATPLARRMAKQKNIDITMVSGTGPRGRITKYDVENMHEIPAMIPPNQNTMVGNELVALKSQLDKLGIAYDTVPTDRMRQIIAERLTKSKSTIPHFYLQIDCKLDALLTFRQQANEYLNATGGGKISINDILVRACANALRTVPQANASWAGDEIIRYKDANISVAVSIDGGLITPVVRQAQNKSLITISHEITDLVARARSGKLKPHEYQGGSFSISNLGMYGVKSFNAIINPPESMILAVGKAESRFIEDKNGNPMGATILSVTLSCDHRVVDGTLGAKWLAEFKRFVENPVLLSMDL